VAPGEEYLLQATLTRRFLPEPAVISLELLLARALRRLRLSRPFLVAVEAPQAARQAGRSFLTSSVLQPSVHAKTLTASLLHVATT
jgi:hypothetical protein